MDMGHRCFASGLASRPRLAPSPPHHTNSFAILAQGGTGTIQARFAASFCHPFAIFPFFPLISPPPLHLRLWLDHPNAATRWIHTPPKRTPPIPLAIASPLNGNYYTTALPPCTPHTPAHPTRTPLPSNLGRSLISLEAVRPLFSCLPRLLCGPIIMSLSALVLPHTPPSSLLFSFCPLSRSSFSQARPFFSPQIHLFLNSTQGFVGKVRNIVLAKLSFTPAHQLAA